MGWRPQRGGGLSTSDTSGPGRGTLDQLLASLGVPPVERHAVGAVATGPPTAVQRVALGAAVDGRDLLAVAPTGSGKSLVFAVGLVRRLAGAPSVPGRPRAVLLAPTRELAEQDAEVVATVAAGAGLRVARFVGGGSGRHDRLSTAAPVDIAVATPGRLAALLRSATIDLRDVRTVVLDEVDQLLSGDFRRQSELVLDRCRGVGLLAVTATAANGVVEDLTTRWPSLQVMSVEDEHPPVHAPASGRPRTLLVLTDPSPEVTATRLGDRCTRALFFVSRRSAVAPLRLALEGRGISAVGVEGSASPTRRESAFASLASGACRVLVTTDLSGRGLDLPEVAQVVHVGLPHSADDLVHRSGRTGRGVRRTGVVAAVVRPDDVPRIRTMADAGDLEVRVLGSEHELEALVGPVVEVPRVQRRRTPAPDPVGRRPRAGGNPDDRRARRGHGRGGRTRGRR